MDPPPVDASGIEVPIYDEDPEEAFIGPQGLNNFQEESDIAEPFTEEYEEDDEYYDGDGSYQPDPLVRSAAQRGVTDDALHAETGSGHTH